MNAFFRLHQRQGIVFAIAAGISVIHKHVIHFLFLFFPAVMFNYRTFQLRQRQKKISAGKPEEIYIE
jgi:hypothetical protein